MRRNCALLLGVLLAAATADAAKRPTPDWLRGAVAYQLVLRTMTREGTFRAATEMLDHVRSAGVDIVYVTPFVEMDCDADRAGWSPRQIAAGWDSPKNPYRISDYDRIDPEYGGDDDFRDFNARAHALGMKVVMDLVYLHCGPNNVLKDRIPDAFQRNPDGTVKTTRWNFPYVNFGSKAVRRYLIDSMLHWMRLGCDGFRCDVGDEVPIDFWQEAMATCRAVDPGLVMINEGVKPEWLEKVFDACYAWPFVNAVRWRLLPPKPADASLAPLPVAMAEVRRYEAKLPDDALMFVYLDNHDTANDDGEKRFDRVNGAEAGNAAFVATFLRRGLPLVFNGNEIADNARSSFFAPVGHPGRARKTVDWARAQQPAGRERLALVRKLADLRHHDRIFSEGTMEFVPDGEGTNVLAFVRRLGDREVLVAANLSGLDVSFDLKSRRVPTGRTILGRLAHFEGTACRMGPWGYLVKEVSADGFTVDDEIPAGNVIVDGIEGDAVRVRPDLRDSPDWIYWAFRVKGAAGRTLRFAFDKRYAGGQVSARGPAVSRDRGRSWSYAAEKTSAWDHFDYTFAADEDEVWFSQTIPYYPSQWEEFLSAHGTERGRLFVADELCRSRRGRSVPRARFGRIDGRGRYRVFLTSRHHCQETMGTHVLEGIVAQVFAETALGRWMRENVEIWAVPFADFDGVVDGDQGKGRRPHDHCRDYDKLTYPETRAIAGWTKDARIDVWLDLHCPWVHGESEEHVFQVLGEAGANTDAQIRFGKLLESVQSGVLNYRQANDFPWNYAWNGPANYRAGWTDRMWAERNVKGIRLADSWEIPFSNANGAVVDAASARAFGADMALALKAFLTEEKK